MPGGAPGTSARPRPGGGFNAGMGSFGEHLDENAMQQAMGQKQQAQQGAQLNPSMAAAQQQLAQQQQQPGSAPTPPREIGSISEELFTRPLKDIVQGVSSLFDIYNWLGIKKYEPDPEKLAKNKQILQNWNQLDAKEQAEARKTTQERIQKKKLEREQEDQRRQQQAMASQELVVPHTPQRGAEGPGGSGKQRATQKLQQDRKTLGGPQSAN
jgi:hypothetical protein